MIIKRQHNQTKVYIMIGCPGAGKSTWIKKNLEPGIKVVLIRYKLGLTSSPDEKYLGTREEENRVSYFRGEKDDRGFSWTKKKFCY